MLVEAGLVGWVAQKKHHLRLIVEKVLIQGRCTFEVWYRLPQLPGVRTLGDMVAPEYQCRYAGRADRQGSQLQAVFRLPGLPTGTSQGRPGALVRLVGRGGGLGSGHLDRAPQPRLGVSAVKAG
jgi:hypothetical protein